MFRNRSPPIPQPVSPASADSSANFLSAQVQQILSAVLPAPIVTILASISDLLYRAILGKPNEPPTYTSTLVPPVLLILVTYLSLLFVYRSVKSFFTFLLFSVKWFVILTIVVVVIAYSLGNGNVEEGARVAAQRTGINMQGNSWADALQRNSLAQQVAPYLGQASNKWGGIAAAVPLVHGASNAVLEMLQGSSNADGRGEGQSRDRIKREYRDVRPAKKRFSFGQEERRDSPRSGSSGRSVSNPGYVQGQRRSSNAFQGIAKFIGADLGE